MSFMEIVAWILIYLGQTLVALAVLTIWAVLGFLVFDEIRAIFRGDTGVDDNTTSGGLE